MPRERPKKRQKKKKEKNMHMCVGSISGKGWQEERMKRKGESRVGAECPWVSGPQFT